MQLYLIVFKVKYFEAESIDEERLLFEKVIFRMQILCEELMHCNKVNQCLRLITNAAIELNNGGQTFFLDNLVKFIENVWMNFE